jgi:hypothetical protein
MSSNSMVWDHRVGQVIFASNSIAGPETFTWAPRSYHRSELIREEFAALFAMLGIYVWQTDSTAVTFFLLKDQPDGSDFFDHSVLWKDLNPESQVLSDEDKNSIMSALEALIKTGEQIRAKNSAR